MALPHFYGTTDKAVVDTWYREFASRYSLEEESVRVAERYLTAELPSSLRDVVSEFPAPVRLTDEELTDFTHRLISEFEHRLHSCPKTRSIRQTSCGGCTLSLAHGRDRSPVDECPIRERAPWTAEQILRMDALLKKFDSRCRYDLKGRRHPVNR